MCRLLFRVGEEEKKTKKKKEKMTSLLVVFFLFLVLFLYVFDVVCAVGDKFCPSGRFGALVGKKGGKKGKKERITVSP